MESNRFFSRAKGIGEKVRSVRAMLLCLSWLESFQTDRQTDKRQYQLWYLTTEVTN